MKSRPTSFVKVKLITYSVSPCTEFSGAERILTDLTAISLTDVTKELAPLIPCGWSLQPAARRVTLEKARTNARIAAPRKIDAFTAPGFRRSREAPPPGTGIGR